MKKVVIVAIALILMFASVVTAKGKDWQTGKLVYHAAGTSVLLQNIPASEQFHADGWTCVGGDETHAPDCHKDADWVATTGEPHTDVILADGSSFRVDKNTDWNTVLAQLVANWNLTSTEAIPTEATFLYKLGKTRKDGATAIEVVMPCAANASCGPYESKARGWVTF